MQLPFGFTIPKVDWNPPSMSDLPDWGSAKRVCIDLETKDPDLKKLGPGNFRPGNHACGYAVAIEDGPAFYLPIRHQGGDNLPEEGVLQYMRDNASRFTGTLVGANLGYDLGFAERDGITFDARPTWYRDVQHIAVLIYELYDRYGLTVIAERLGLPGKDESELNAFATAYGVDPKRDIYKLPGRAAARYAMQDVRLPLQILRRQERIMEELGIQSICDLEARVLPVLVKMRRRGVRVNLNKVDRIATWALEQESNALAMLQALTGVSVKVGDCWKADVMAAPLYAAGFKVPLNAPNKKGHRSPSVEKDFLAKCGDVGKCILRVRAYNKLRTTFCARVHEYQINGRVHPVLHQLRNTKEGKNETDEAKSGKGARYGRFSAEHYNIQQEPMRDDEFGAMWRSIYECEPGGFWVCSDWSQQEPRVGVFYAEKLGLPGAKAFADGYRANPKMDVHQALADISGMPRKIVKNFVNGRLYGMGDAKLCRSINCETIFKPGYDGKMRECPGEEGQAKIDQFNKFAPWLSMLTREASKAAKARGVVWTFLKRRCNFPKDSQGNFDWIHKAFSRIGQGSAADQMKATVVEADKEGIPLQLIVHDEFDYTETDIKRMRRLRELQMDTVRFGDIPMYVDQEVGENWGEINKFDSPEAQEFLKRWAA